MLKQRIITALILLYILLRIVKPMMRPVFKKIDEINTPEPEPEMMPLTEPLLAIEPPASAMLAEVDWLLRSSVPPESVTVEVPSAPVAPSVTELDVRRVRKQP